MKGMEVLVRVSGETFKLHRTEYWGDDQREPFRANSWDATNDSPGGYYHWVYVPEAVIGTFESAVGGARVVRFEDVIIGPMFGTPCPGWPDKFIGEA